MAFKLKLALQLAGLLLTTLLLGWVAFATDYHATLLLVVLLLGVQLASLWRTLTVTNRELARFLNAISHNDFTQSFKPIAGDTEFRALSNAFESIAERFRQTRSDKELQAAYLSAFIERLPTAVLALDEQGGILHSNTALRDLLELSAPPRTLMQINQRHPVLTAALDSLKPSASKQVRLSNTSEPKELTLACTILRSRGQQQKLVTLQNIRFELDAQELQAWQNLIRVMTHEIMNSITPLASLADTAQQCLEESRMHVAVREDAQLQSLLDDVQSALLTIGSRGQGLLRFVDSYRRLSRLPSPVPRRFLVRDCFDNLRRLIRPQMDNVRLECHCTPETLELHADPEQLEQALLNLINNALDAVQGMEQPRLRVLAFTQNARVLVRVEDNGCGMNGEQLEQIFVPFYTTKKQGNGIGMSVVRQIAQLNGGRIDVESTPGNGTRVTMSF